MNMKLNATQLTIIYDPNSNIGKQTVAYAHTVSKHINYVNPAKEKFTGRMWREILQKLKTDDPKVLLNKSHPRYQEKIAGWSFEGDDWARVLINNPDLLRAPIAIKGNRAVLCNTPSDILKLGD